MVFWYSAHVTLKTVQFLQLTKVSYNLSRIIIYGEYVMQKFCYLLHAETRPMKSWNWTGIFDLNLTDLLHWLQRLNPSASSLLSVSKHIFITMELSRNLAEWPMLIFSREKYGFVNVAVLYEIFLQFHFWIHIQYLLTVYMHQPICRQLTAMVLFPWKQTESVKLF